MDHCIELGLSKILVFFWVSFWIIKRLFTGIIDQLFIFVEARMIQNTLSNRLNFYKNLTFIFLVYLSLQVRFNGNNDREDDSSNLFF